VQPRNQGYLHQDTLGPSHPHIGLGDSSRLDTRKHLLSAEMIFENVEKWKISCLKKAEKGGCSSLRVGLAARRGPPGLAPPQALIIY